MIPFPLLCNRTAMLMFWPETRSPVLRTANKERNFDGYVHAL